MRSAMAASVGLALAFTLGSIACRQPTDPSTTVPAYDRETLESRVAAKVARLEAATLADPTSVAAWGRLGMTFQAHALYPQAVACYDLAGQLDPSDYRWPYLAALALEGSDLEAALPLFERATRLDPPGEAVFLATAQALGESGQLDSAQAVYEQVLEQAPRSARANLGLGRLALAAGNLEQARSHLTAAVESEPTLGEAHRLLATVSRRLDDTARGGDHDELARAFQQSAQPRDPALEEMSAEAVSSRSYTARGRKLAARGLYAEAEVQFREVLRIRDPNVRDLTNLGGALAGQQKLGEALGVYRQALALNPDDAVAHNNLGMALAASGRNDEAEEALRKALALNPRYAEAHANLGLLLVQTNRAEPAIEAFRTAIEIDPGRIGAHNDLAATLGRLGRSDEAIAVWTNALRFGPEDPSLLYNSSLALIQLGGHREAISRLRRGLEAAPNSSRFASLLAWELATAPDSDLRDGPEALSLARRVHDAYPRDPSAVDVLAAALAETGDFSGAVETAERALYLAQQAPRQELVSEIGRRLDLYRKRQPFRQ